jgi:hypothetical protein
LIALKSTMLSGIKSKCKALSRDVTSSIELYQALLTQHSLHSCRIERKLSCATRSSAARASAAACASAASTDASSAAVRASAAAKKKKQGSGNSVECYVVA